MLTIAHAVLHAFDFEVGSSYLSAQELDMSERATKSYVQRHLRKVSSSAESRHGSFAENSSFAEKIGDYFAGRLDFLALSEEIALYFWEELRKSDGPGQCDVLVADFSETIDIKAAGASSGTAVGAAMAAAADDAFEGRPRRRFAVLLLPRRQAFVHDLRSVGGEGVNDVIRTDAALPNPTQKVDSYLLVDADDLSIDFSDKPRTIGGRESLVIPDGLLQCSAAPSSKEVVEELTQIVEDVAEEYGLTPALVVSKAKAAVTQRVELEESFSPAEVAEAIFEERPDMRERFEEKAREKRLPEEVPVKRGVANRMAKSHKIRTDTGIEISFPSDLVERPGLIEFSREADGRVTITMRGIAKIENR